MPNFARSTTRAIYSGHDFARRAMHDPIYLDHHAATPLDPRVADLLVEVQRIGFANPNSAHAAGRSARRWIERARGEVASLVGAEPEDVRFTASASEALALALAYAMQDGPRPLRVVCSPIEHPALLSALDVQERAGRVAVSWLSVDGQGRVQIGDLVAALPGADLLCLMAVNNEVGTIQEVEQAARAAAAAGVATLVDASQAAGRMPLNAQAWGLDYLVLTSHKIYGPRGAAALVGSGLAHRTGPPEASGHAPTPNVVAIAGFGEAARLARAEGPRDEARIGELRDHLQRRLLEAIPGAVVNGDAGRRVAANLHISVEGAANDAVTAQLDPLVALSTGAACVSGVDQPSHVLQAMGLEPWRLDGALRISLGRFTTPEEVDRAADLIIAAVRKVRTLLDKVP